MFFIRCRFPKSKSLPDIRCRYGNHVIKIIRRYQKLFIAWENLTLILNFWTHVKITTFVLLFNIKYDQHVFQNSDAYRQLQRLFIQEELTFNTVEQQKIVLEMESIKSDLSLVINLIYLTHINRRLLESNIKTIKTVEGIQNYKL